MIRPISIKQCEEIGFPYIQETLTASEPAPIYAEDPSGMGELEKVLNFSRSDEYYPTFFEKAAYLISSIAASQYFTNGNKRLAVVVLLLFLSENRVLIRNLNFEGFCKLLFEEFPRANIEENKIIEDPHALFLYNLAIILGDRTVWDISDFQELRLKVAKIFEAIYKLQG